MAKKLLVRQPLTTDGNTLRYDENQHPVYSESYVEVGAQRQFESLNSSLPSHLRYQFKVVDVEFDEIGRPIHKIEGTKVCDDTKEEVKTTKK